MREANPARLTGCVVVVIPQCTPLYLVCAEDADNAEEIVRALLAKGADVNKPSVRLSLSSMGRLLFPPDRCD